MNVFKQIIKNELGINLLPLNHTTLDGTMLAVLECDENGKHPIINISNKILDERDLLFALSHEMRHYWQLTKGDIKLESHKPSLNTEKYNLQIEEIDAHAFAWYVMEKYYNVKPLFNGLSENTKQAISNYKLENFK